MLNMPQDPKLDPGSGAGVTDGGHCGAKPTLKIYACRRPPDQEALVQPV